VSVDGISHTGNAGNSFFFKAHLPTKYRNTGESIARLVWINTRRCTRVQGHGADQQVAARALIGERSHKIATPRQSSVASALRALTTIGLRRNIRRETPSRQLPAILARKAGCRVNLKQRRVPHGAALFRADLLPQRNRAAERC